MAAKTAELVIACGGSVDVSRSDRQIDDMLDALVSLARKEGKGKGEEKLYAVEILAQKFKRARARERSGSAVPDGYPRGSGLGGVSGGMQWEVEADRFEGESRIGLTPVELATEQRVFEQKRVKDWVHDLYVGAETDLERVYRSLDDMKAKLDRIDNLVDTNPDAAGAVVGCRSHARLRDGSGRDYFEPLDRERGARDGLCAWCYSWRRDHDELPSVPLLERKIRKGVITTKDVEETKRAS